MVLPSSWRKNDYADSEEPWGSIITYRTIDLASGTCKYLYQNWASRQKVNINCLCPCTLPLLHLVFSILGLLSLLFWNEPGRRPCFLIRLFVQVYWVSASHFRCERSLYTIWVYMQICFKVASQISSVSRLIEMRGGGLLIQKVWHK